MTRKKDKPVLEIVQDAKKPKSTNPKGSGTGDGSGNNATIHFGDYAIINNAFHHIKAVRGSANGDGFIEIPLCDFTCKITEEVTKDTGLEDQTILRIEGVRNDGLKLPLVDVLANKFFGNQANWVNEAWGTRAFIYPGSQKKDNVRACVHLFSQLVGNIPRRVIYQYSGWKLIDSKWNYLTNTGAITKEGLSHNVQVDLGTSHMSRYGLPLPANTEQLITASKSITDLLEICPAKKQIGAALLCAAVRAPLGELQPIDFGVFINGVTGAMKSSITAIPLAFFGDFNARRFPSNFSDTENAMEAKAFRAKDAMFVIDDFKPSVSQSEAAKLHSKAERFIRNTGNQCGRARLTADMQARAEPYNRSMTIITGEETPKGSSLLGRLLVLDISRVDVNTNTLTDLQKAAETGVLAGLMSAYLQWLAPRMDDLKKQFPSMVTQLRNSAIHDGYANSHPRAPEIYANLVAGAEIFLDFMIAEELLTSEQSNTLLLDIESSLQDACGEQKQHQKEQDEVERFLELLRATFSSGHAHIACRLKQGPPPLRPHAWGWRADATSSSLEKVLKPMGDCIGWYCDKSQEIWLQKDAAFAVVQRLAKTQGEAFLISPSSLLRRMNEKGLICATEKRQKGSELLSVKRIVAGSTKRVTIFSADLIESG